MGVLGRRGCEACNVHSPGAMEGPETPLSKSCRLCHYAIEDLLNIDALDCLHHGLDHIRCLSYDRNDFNYRQDVDGILKPGVVVPTLGEDGMINDYVYGDA